MEEPVKVMWGVCDVYEEAREDQPRQNRKWTKDHSMLLQKKPQIVKFAIIDNIDKYYSLALKKFEQYFKKNIYVRLIKNILKTLQ